MHAMIVKVLEEIYGTTIYNGILADEIMEKALYRDQEKLRLRIWDFYSGGDTAEVAAARIAYACGA